VKIGLISDSPFGPTGYSKVARYLGRNLAEFFGHQVTYCVLTYAGDPITSQGLKIYEGASPAAMHRYVAEVRPNVLIHIRDSWVFIPKYYPPAYQLYPVCQANMVKLVLHTPIQSHPVPPEYSGVSASQCDFTVTMTKYGRDVLMSQGVPNEKLDWIYHGVNTEIFKPMDKKKCRKHLGFDPKVPLVGYVGMNIDYRKMIPKAMIAFKEVLKTFPDAELCLWTEPVAHWDLETWKNNLQLQGKVYHPTMTKTWGVTEEETAMLYNSFDCYLHTSSSEGFGLPLLEAMACGVPAVCTDTPVTREVLGQYPHYATSRYDLPTVWGSLEYSIDMDEAAKAVVVALEGKPESAFQETKKYGLNRAKEFSWESAAVKLDSLLMDVTGGWSWVKGRLSDDNLGWMVSHEQFLRTELLVRGGTFIDVGAHVGRWAIRAARYYNQVIAFEPNPEAAAVLEENVSLNHLKNVEVVRKALWNRTGTLKLYKGKQSGWTKIEQEAREQTTEGEGFEVAATTFDERIRMNLYHTTTVKIDTEGAELQVLEGMKKFLTRRAGQYSKAVVEIHRESDQQKVIDFFDKYGWSARVVTDTLTPTQSYVVAT